MCSSLSILWHCLSLGLDPCSAQDGETAELVGELGGGPGEQCFGVRSWAEAEGWGQAAQVQSPLLSDGASKLGRG